MSRRLKRWLIGAAATLTIAPLSACGTVSTAHLVVSQTAEGAGQDHKSHVAPGTLIGITLSIANTGTGPARGVTVTDVLPSGFHYYELTTIGGDSIRTHIDDPGAQGGPRWGTWTIPAGSTGKESTLVISFKVQVPLKPGDYPNEVNVSTDISTAIEAGPAAVVTVDPRPSITVTTAATTSSAVSGGGVTYVISVSNVGSAVAHGIAVSISLPPGFLYQTTSGLDGNGSRVQSIDPPASSLLPLWAAWDLPAMQNGTPGLLRITFLARVLPAVSAGLYTVTTGLTGGQDVPPQTIGNTAPVAVGKGTTVAVTTRVAAQSPFAPLNGDVSYVITVENDSTDAAQNVTITDTLPQGLTYAATTSISINGRGSASRLSPVTGTGTPQWGPFSIPAGGYAGSTLVIVFTAHVSASASLGSHADVVSGTSSNAQITGGSDQTPVVITAG